MHIGEPTTLGVRVASLVAALQGGAASGLNETDTRKRARLGGVMAVEVFRLVFQSALDTSTTCTNP